MNDEDLRDLFAFGAMQGLLSAGTPYARELVAFEAYTIADAMIEAKYDEDREEPEVEEGITSIKPKRKVK